MARNIVICCDGTDNEFGYENTNVVRLIQSLVALWPRNSCITILEWERYPNRGSLRGRRRTQREPGVSRSEAA
jgi:hypothetical protein